MSAATPNPFAAYQPPPSAGPAAAPQSTVAGRVKLVSVIAIVLGSLGLATTLMGAVGQFVGTRMQSAFTSFQQPGLPPEMRDAQQAMQAEMQGIQIRFRPASIAVLIGHFAVSAALLWGGIQCLRLKLRGRPLLLVTCLATSVFEVMAACHNNLCNLPYFAMISPRWEWSYVPCARRHIGGRYCCGEVR